jgi:hypothetical protein
VRFQGGRPPFPPTRDGSIDVGEHRPGVKVLERWTGEGLFVLVEGLARLKAMYPERTSLRRLKLGRLVPREEALV